MTTLNNYLIWILLLNIPYLLLCIFELILAIKTKDYRFLITETDTQKHLAKMGLLLIILINFMVYVCDNNMKPDTLFLAGMLSYVFITIHHTREQIHGSKIDDDCIRSIKKT